MPKILYPVIAAVFACGLAACGGDGDTAAAPGGSTDIEDADAVVEVLAEDISFPRDVYETEAGSVGFIYDNVGNIRHTLVIEDVDGFKLDVNQNGDVDRGVVDLEPGTYTLFCDIAGHRPAGMVADLVVS